MRMVENSDSAAVEAVVDAFGRPLKSLRLSVTDRCNLRCSYCMPEEEYVWFPREDVLTFEEMAALSGYFTDLGVDKVRLTGGEPQTFQRPSKRIDDRFYSGAIAMVSSGFHLLQTTFIERMVTMLSVITRPPRHASPESRPQRESAARVTTCLASSRVFFDPDLPARRMLQLPDRGDLL